MHKRLEATAGLKQKHLLIHKLKRGFNDALLTAEGGRG